MPEQPCIRITAAIKVFPNAYHAWDFDRPPRNYRGHHLEYNAKATRLSEEAVRDFLARFLD